MTSVWKYNLKQQKQQQQQQQQQQKDKLFGINQKLIKYLIVVSLCLPNFRPHG